MNPQYHGKNWIFASWWGKREDVFGGYSSYEQQIEQNWGHQTHSLFSCLVPTGKREYLNIFNKSFPKKQGQEQLHPLSLMKPEFQGKPGMLGGSATDGEIKSDLVAQIKMPKARGDSFISLGKLGSPS